jgi:IrrE N-terminal-like domain
LNRILPIDADATQRHLKSLLALARANGVQVHRFSSLGLKWKGLYLLCEGQAAVALCDGMSPEEEVWVLAHELGHHFLPPYRGLFSPFVVNVAADRPRHRSRKQRRRQPDEERANNWAAVHLISEGDWKHAEAIAPVDLVGMASALGLPPEATVCWQRAKLWERYPDASGAVPVSRSAVHTLEEACTGVGGHQALFTRVLSESRKRAPRLRISFQDFLFARERAYTSRGGWLPYYATLLGALRSPIHAAGGVEEFFGLST